MRMIANEPEVPVRTKNQHGPRTYEFEARIILRKRGFPLVVRVADPSLPINLIAWSKQGTAHLYRVVASRRAVASAAAAAAIFPEEIRQLQAIPRPPAGSVNLWIHHELGWKCYRVLPGGIIDTEGSDVE
jgi:hypothetical protein